MKRTPHRRGYLIVEMLFWLGLLTVFAFVAGHLFVRTFRVIHDSGQQVEDETRFDTAVRQLRRDVAQAKGMDVQGQQTLVVHRPAGDVQWRSDGNGISRSSSGDVLTWQVGQPVQFAIDGQVVLVRTNPGDGASDLAIAPDPEMR